ncbi:histone h2b [Stylonychia lemnae]|uniref:Histone h2b n=1 Tax=Stylonychia lemnae TaxID=5949 RepID=A0A078B8T7_STYLE|nr:histone h2b [Stylonychia lemnae]|eukprot:CDW90905.1 histone h2b [Stylonychia lemnae]
MQGQKSILKTPSKTNLNSQASGAKGADSKATKVDTVKNALQNVSLNSRQQASSNSTENVPAKKADRKSTLRVTNNQAQIIRPNGESAVNQEKGKRGRKKSTGTDAQAGQPGKLGATLDEKAKKKRNTRLRGENSFQTYIFRVMKEIKPELSISKNAIAQLNQILANLFENLMDESRRLMIFCKKSTLSSKEIESSIKLLFPGELAKLGVQYGKSSLQKFTENAQN